MSDHERTRDLDVVVYGATGFVGVAGRRVPGRARPARAPASPWPAGPPRSSKGPRRSPNDALGVDWPVIVADAADVPALAKLAARARVVITTVGPYAQVRPRAGARLRRRRHRLRRPDRRGAVRPGEHRREPRAGPARPAPGSCTPAGSTRSRRTSACTSCTRRWPADGAGELTDTTLVVTSVRGGLSGGTIDSMRHQLDVIKKDRALRRVAASPYSLSPDRAAEPDLGRQEDMVSVPGSGGRPVAARQPGAVRHGVLQHPGGAAQQRAARLGVRPPLPLPRGDERRHVAAVAGARRRPSRSALGALVVGHVAAADPVRARPAAAQARRRARTSAPAREGHFTMDIFTTTTTGAALHGPGPGQGRSGVRGHRRHARRVGAGPGAGPRRRCRRPRAACSPRRPESATRWSTGCARPAWRSPPGGSSRSLNTQRRQTKPVPDKRRHTSAAPHKRGATQRGATQRGARQKPCRTSRARRSGARQSSAR